MNTTYTINRLGHQGDGVGDGPIFAPRTLPGEVVTGVRNGSQLTDIRIETPSSDRVQPPCRHYKSCGGCQVQHATSSFVASWKQQIVQAALNAQGIETDLRPILTSPPQARRRATLAVRRTKKGALAGFHARASDVIIPVPDCQLLDPRLLAGIPVAESLAIHGASRKGVMAVTLTVSDAGLDVSAGSDKMLDGPMRVALAQITEQYGLARLAWNDEVIAMRAAPVQRFGVARVIPPPGAFLQATRDGEAALLAAVQEITSGSERIVDLFAGCGTFCLPLASDAEVHAVEGDADMIAALDLGWRQSQGLKHVSSEARDLFRRPLLPDELSRFEAAVLDPPRAGAETQVSELVRSKIRTLAYVSCNPVTFARDAKLLLQAGYQLDWVQVIDQFRWSSHVELVGSFTRNGTGAS